MRSRRLGILGAFAAVMVAGVLLLVLVVTLSQTSRAFTVGVQTGGPAVVIPPGQGSCQLPLNVPPGGTFDRVRVKIGTYGKPGPPLLFTIQDASTGRRLASGLLAGGYPDITVRRSYVQKLDRSIPAGTRNIASCVSNVGKNRIALYGNGGAAAGTSSAVLNGAPTGVDLDMIFERTPRSYASELGTILDRAVLFRSPRFDGTVYVIVLLLLMAGAVAGVVAAVRSVDEPPDGPSSPA